MSFLFSRCGLSFTNGEDKYGSIYRTRMLGESYIIITHEGVAEDLLVTRANIYSDRRQIRSLFDSKSSSGSMQHLPLMGRMVC